MALYGWIEALQGDMGVAGRTANVDLSFNDILKHLDSVFMGAVEVGCNRWSVMGFSRKSIAPMRVASTAVSMVAWPLIMITGISRRPCEPHSLRSVTPSVSGIQMSSSTRSGRPRKRAARACAAFSASSTVCPSS